jgi:hypothetical protein
MVEFMIDAGLVPKEARGSLLVTGEDLDELIDKGYPTDLSSLFELYPNQWYRVEDDLLSHGIVLYWKFKTPSITSLK